MKNYADIFLEDLASIVEEMGADAEEVLREWGIGAALTPAQRGARTKRISRGLESLSKDLHDLTVDQMQEALGLTGDTNGNA